MCNAFLDVFSVHGCGYMMRNTKMEQTLMAKQAIELELSKHNVSVKRYHDDNESFSERTFREEVHDNSQSITHFAVWIHHQNGMIMRYMSKITHRGRIMLLCAKRFWTEAITHIITLYS